MPPASPLHPGEREPRWRWAGQRLALSPPSPPGTGSRLWPPRCLLLHPWGPSCQSPCKNTAIFAISLQKDSNLCNLPAKRPQSPCKNTSIFALSLQKDSNLCNLPAKRQQSLQSPCKKTVIFAISNRLTVQFGLWCTSPLQFFPPISLQKTQQSLQSLQGLTVQSGLRCASSLQSVIPLSLQKHNNHCSLCRDWLVNLAFDVSHPYSPSCPSPCKNTTIIATFNHFFIRDWLYNLAFGVPHPYDLPCRFPSHNNHCNLCGDWL